MPFDRCFKHHLRHVATLEKKFSQGKGLPNLDDDILHPQVEGGYCFGAAMGWLKITLDKEALNFAKAIDHSKTAHVHSMARGHVLHGKAQVLAASRLRDAALENVGARRNEIEEARQKAVKRARKTAQAELDEASAEYSRSFSIAANHKDMAGKLDKVKEILEETYRQAEVRAQEKFDQAKLRAQTWADNKQNSITPDEVTQEELVQETWKILEQVEKGKYTGAITPVKRIEPEGVRTVGDFVRGVVGAPAFMVGRGMIVSFETGKAATGQTSVLSPPAHAVALYRVDANKYWLFEPNLGVFVVDGRMKLIYALVLILADGYDKRIPGDDSAIVFCKTTKTFPDQGDDAVDPGVMVDRDKAKSAMKTQLLEITKHAFDQGLEALKSRKGTDEVLIKAANKAMQNAFLRARVSSADIEPSKLLDPGSTGSTFMKNRGQIRDTGLSRLNEALDGIF